MCVQKKKYRKRKEKNKVRIRERIYGLVFVRLIFLTHQTQAHSSAQTQPN